MSVVIVSTHPAEKEELKLESSGFKVNPDICNATKKLRIFFLTETRVFTKFCIPQTPLPKNCTRGDKIKINQSKLHVFT